MKIALAGIIKTGGIFK